MQLIVHVGPGKTGTTAIQKSLLKATETLRARGILYIGLMFERGPIQLFPWQRPGGFDEFHRLPKDRARHELDTLLRGTLAAAAGAGADTLVLSNESLLRREAVFLEVLEQLRSEGIALLVVAYARRYDELARSAYVQWGLNHKTYAGPLKNFQQWMQGRELALSPSIMRWRSRLGSDFQLRNFDACGNVVVDFLRAVGLGSAGVEPLRVYESPSVNEIALRALFNEQQPGAVASSRFTNLFESNKLSFTRPLGAWLRTLMPDADGMVELEVALARERANINQLLSEDGQPPLDEGVEDAGPLQLDTEAMLATLFQLIARQALKIEALEHAMAGAFQPPQDEQSPDQASTSVAQAADVSIDPTIRQALVPALGYFGASASDNLQLALPGKVKKIRLSLCEKKPTFLNLRGLELRYRGKPMDVGGARRGVATQSSISGNQSDNGPDCLLEHTGMHSAAEVSPWWQIVFDTPVAIDELHLSNRGDGWGSRSRSLAIDIVDHDGRSLRLYDGQSTRNLASVVAATSDAAAIEVAAWPATAAAALALRSRLLSSIAERIRKRAVALDAVDWRGVVPMLDVWRSHEPPADEWTVIAAFLLSQQQAKGGTSIKSFSLLLDSQVRLERLQHEINELARALDLDGFMLTRHGIKPEGMLRREPERFLAHMEAVLASLERMGREPALAYGTLLGAVREGHFIAHDDDIDLLYRSKATSRAEVEAELPVIKELLQADGFKVVDLLPNSLNMHVIDPKHRAVMDVFPCWEEDGLLQMHMEGMKVRGISPSIVYPTGSIEFLGEQLPVPAKPEDYLEERYGAGWRVSDQFFEWPWQLKSPDQ